MHDRPKKGSQILYGREPTVERGVLFMQHAKEKMDLFGDKNGPSIILEFEVYRNNYVDLINRGGKIRLITEITKDNIQYCKALMKIVTELRHLDGLVGGIAVSESEYMSTTALKHKELLSIGFYSDEEEVVRSGQYIFDTFWEKATPAKRRIKEIEENLVQEFIKTIQDPEEIHKLIPKILSSANEEIQILFPSASAFRIYYDEGILDLMKKKAEDIVIRILIKKDKSISELVETIFSKLPNVQVLQSISINAKVVTMIIDKQKILSVEIADSAQHNILDTVGLATYSNSRPTVQSSDSIFEMLWIQAEMQNQKMVD